MATTVHQICVEIARSIGVRTQTVYTAVRKANVKSCEHVYTTRRHGYENCLVTDDVVAVKEWIRYNTVGTVRERLVIRDMLLDVTDSDLYNEARSILKGQI